MTTRRILATILIALCTATCVFAQSNSAKRDKLSKEIGVLNEQMASLQSQNADATAKLNILNEQISRRKALLNESEKELAGINSEIRAKEKEIKAAQAQLDTLKARYARLIKVAYKNRDARIWYMYVLSSRNLAQATHRYTYLKNLSGQMNDQMGVIRDAAEDLLAQKEELEIKRADAKTVRDRRAAEVNSLQNDQANAKKLVKQISANKKKVQAEIDAKKKQMSSLNKAMAAAVSSATTKEAASGKSSDFGKKQGHLPWPVDGVIVEKFGQHYHPVYKNVKLPYNNGVNIATSTAAPVKAIYAGTVKQVIVMPGYNQCILVQHGSYYTFYCKLRTVSVKAGDKVKAGEQIGIVDTISGQTQLHFELWKGKTPQNPENWLVK